MTGRKNRKDDHKMARIPKDFLDAASSQAMLRGYPTRSSFLRDLAKDLKPTIEELKAKKLVREDNEKEFF